MRPLCRLDSSELPVVVDASVVINLNASGYADSLLGGLPRRFLVPDVVIDEIAAGATNARGDVASTYQLIERGHLCSVRLNETAFPEFERLVCGSAEDTLDDGEAATISYALATKAIAAIDERKANRICAERYPGLSVVSTVDIFCHPETERILGREGLEMAVFQALQEARMSVLPHHADWVVKLIGHERAKACPSLRRLLRERQNSPSRVVET